MHKVLTFLTNFLEKNIWISGTILIKSQNYNLYHFHRTLPTAISGLLSPHYCWLKSAWQHLCQQIKFFRHFFPVDSFKVSIKIIGKSCSRLIICTALSDMVPFVQLKNVKSKHGGLLLLLKFRLQSATVLKVTLLYGCFSHLLNCTNGTKLRKAFHLKKFIPLIWNGEFRLNVLSP